MELWVRSQDRENLYKADKFYLDDEAIDCRILSDDWGCLGTYQSKKRALEVLDEIQKYKDKLENAWFLGMTESTFVSSTYEMPKE